MVSFKLTTLALAAFSTLTVAAQDAKVSDLKQSLEGIRDSVKSAASSASSRAASGVPKITDIADANLDDAIKWAQSKGSEAQWKADNPSASAADSAALDVSISVSFPDAEIFGVKLVNGRPTRALLSVVNNEDVPVKPLIVLGALKETGGGVVMRNLTAARFGNDIPPKGKEVLTYAFSTIMQPRDVTLEMKVLVQRGGRVFTVKAFEEGVSVVEAPVSILDPQIIFLYLFLLAALGGVSYFIYTTYVASLFPAKPKRRSGGKDGSRAQRSSGGSKAVDSADAVDVVGADGPAVASGTALGGKGYDESWIPAGHLQRPQAKRVGSGRPKSRAA
ncbi:hypothetical protein TI39_contig617g00004 [Zymoseptoria brevis]|uniref:Translocon-associated protein subunit alpha n=1 Tax=Zymoseptoria brevis TaxID=1047168 RepID=A0A0F4GGL3_9PEZI|nr:hypothetical protein TI39_contig617g00004 [Zymoseptoria brevis]